MSKKRVFLIVLDSFGVGELPDAADFSDEGSNTLGAVKTSDKFNVPNLARLGLFNIDGCGDQKFAPIDQPIADFGKMLELSRGKDTTTGHWEIAGIVSERPLPTYPEGFPSDLIAAFESATGRGVLCNKPYSGTEVIKDFGDEHLKTGKLIVYTSADSVFQIAAHEDIVPLAELYKYCEIARGLLVGEHGVGRVIARPFGGEYPFRRLSGRHDYSLLPPEETMLDRLSARGLEVISVGKINDIFAGKGVSESNPTVSNMDGMDKTIAFAQKDFCGLCFVNLVDFDMVFGHRNDVDGYAQALSDFDVRLGELMPLLRDDDLLIITADHGCDPSTPSTDHSREYVPLLVYSKSIGGGTDLGTIRGFSHVASMVESYLK